MSKTIVFKFGGASVKDAKSIENLFNILFNRLRNRTLIVISAMGKTTNGLEEILRLKLNGDLTSSNSAKIKDFHLGICREIFPPESMIFSIIENLFMQMDRDLDKPLTQENYDAYYDQIVSYGELLSSRILQEYLCFKGIFCIWQDAREIISTNSNYRFAEVDWDKTKNLCLKHLGSKLEQYPVVTQGFIGADPKGKTTTLGREGSDFTAAILAFCLNAQSVTIWKDVDGVRNADPKRFSDTVKFEELDYREAAELAFYGASVIHPKTIKPLANLFIPLYVKSFLSPEAVGTKICQVSEPMHIPCTVVKDNQILVSFRVTDFTFIAESHIHRVYEVLKKLKLKVNMLQVSAISISIVIDMEMFALDQLISTLQNDFSVKYNDALQLITVKNQNADLVEALLKGKEALLEQVTRSTFQFVHKP
ncbi:aspartate kinase [Rhodonellum sp.]|uniref:aspartate kinase n=1 Tax=Rhodonellum sp. TaxID=2231180 RepID=UPI002720D711|nr:aspartate kinase [Rhodonellum sp.]MDO9552084.1 aspartate kinase [Rhodonellum sp.]